MMFAFSRDGAVPGGRQFFRKVSRRHRVPVNAVIAIAVLSWALMLPTLANGAIGYLVGTSIAVIGLYIAYGVPIYLRYRAGDSFQPGAWTLGKHYKWINPIAVVWIVFIVILFLMPTVPTAIPWHSGFNWNVVNYAPITVGGVLALVGIWWLVSAHKWFKGPVREGTEEELERIEAGDGTPHDAHRAAPLHDGLDSKKGAVMFETIVWATDGSELANRALVPVMELARTHHSKIVAVHANEVLKGRFGAAPVLADEFDIADKIKEQVAELHDLGFDVEFEVVNGTGDVPTLIAKAAEKADADLIVVGTHGWGGFQAAVLGSVARGLLHTAKCAVLSIPPEAKVRVPA